MMTISPQTPDVALPLAAYIRRHYPPARHWPREILLGWVRWHLGENFFFYVTDGEDNVARRIAGVAVVRPVMDPEHGREDYRFDPEGPCLFVDVAVATHPNALLCLTGLARQRFGFRPRMAYQRRERDKIVVRSFLGFHRRIFNPTRAEKLAQQP